MAPPFVDVVLSLEDLSKLLWENPQALLNMVLCGATPDAETAKAHVAFANVPAVPDSVRKQHRFQPVHRLPFRDGHAYVTDLVHEGDTWLTRVIGPFNKLLHFHKMERLLRDLAFTARPLNGIPPRHLMLAGPSGPASTLAETGERNRQQAILRQDHPAEANDHVTFVPGAVVRAFSRTTNDGKNLKIRSGFNVVSRVDIRARVDEMAELKWLTILPLPGEIPLGISRAWRNGAFIATCISQGANHGQFPTRPITYRAYRAFVHDGFVACEEIPDLPSVEALLEESGVFLATTTCGSSTDRPLAACCMPDQKGSPEFSHYEDLPDGLGNLIRILDGMEREHLAKSGF